jgi:diacylglycerol O-acyltransferase
VFLSITGAALRRYLLELKALPKKPLIGQIPVNIRTSEGSEMGNALAFIYSTLGTDISDPIARLNAVSHSTEAAKSIHTGLSASAIEPFTMLMLAPYMTEVILGLGGYTRAAANLVISNVTGPRERLFFNGARVEQIYGPSVLIHGQALNITMSSYVDEINIGYTACRDSLPSIQRLAVYSGEALAELEEELGLAGKAK